MNRRHIEALLAALPALEDILNEHDRTCYEHWCRASTDAERAEAVRNRDGARHLVTLARNAVSAAQRGHPTGGSAEDVGGGKGAPGERAVQRIGKH